MSDAIKDVKFSSKVLINKQRTEVLFAEIDSDFADVLLSFLTLPLGTIVRVMNKHYGDKAPVFGSISTLYDGLSNLDSAHFCTEGGKWMLLEPSTSFKNECHELKLDIGDTQPTKYFCCENWDCYRPKLTNISMYYGTVRCGCGKLLKKELPVRNVPKGNDGDGVFTIRTATFIISDDLQILPNVTASVRQIVGDLGLMDIDGTELRNVTFGFDEIMDLLKGSLLGRAPLSNVILKKQMKYEPGISFHWFEIRATVNSMRLVLKVILQKSTNKLLFAEAEEDFVDFLFSLLTIPLGGVECLLGSNSCLKNIDNLYRSISCPVDSKILRIQETTKLIKPTIPHGYLSKTRVLPLTEEQAAKLFYLRTPNDECLRPCSTACHTFKSPKGEGNYVKGPRKHMVKDDLTVTPLCVISYLSALSERKIPLSDVDELVLHIGLEEAKSILKASLSSTSALSSGLHPLLKKQPKPEN